MKNVLQRETSTHSEPLFIEWFGTKEDDFISYLDTDVPVNAKGRKGDDQIYGSDADDSLWGGRGNDQLLGGNGGDDFLRGGRGDDYLDGGNGSDVLLGGQGNDTMFFVADNIVTGGQGHDTFRTTGFASAGFAQIDFNKTDVLEIYDVTRADITSDGNVLMVREFDGQLVIGGASMIAQDIDLAIEKGWLVLPDSSPEPVMLFDGLMV